MSDPVLLGIDAGGSRVRAVAVAGDRRLHSGEGGPSGAVGTDPAELVVNLGRALAGCPQPEIVVACAAGAGGEAGRERIEALLAPRFPGSELHVLPDYAAAWAAAPAGTELLVIAGTGSAVCGEDVAGELRAAGGLGWIAGDHGSAARLGRSLLEEVARPGGDGLPDGLEEGLESVFGAARPAEIAARLHAAAAPQALLAAAAPLLTAAAERGGERAVELLEAEMLPLARTAAVHLERLRGPTGERAGEPARMVLAGGVLTSAAARDAFIAGLGRLGLEVEIGALERRPVEGALRLAGEIAARTGGDGERPQPAPGAGTDLRPPTERPNRRSRGLGEMSAAEVVALMDAEEPRSLAAVAAAAGPIVTAAERVAALCSEGGRIVLLGSGTSGRIALTEAAELRPTFGVPEEAFSAYVAGGSGPAAIAASEDDEAAAPAKLRELGLGRGDGVIGLAASGSTPFVLAGITAAREAGAWTCGIANNPGAPLLATVEHPILLETGPEVLTGSTRLQAATAQKLTLNRITTAAMVLDGRVLANHMVEMRVTIAKLERRALGVVADLAGVDEREARKRLERSDWNVRAALGSAEPATGAPPGS